jgi:hypothetical protein
MSAWFGAVGVPLILLRVVFISLLLLTILAGLVKVFFDRRKSVQLTVMFRNALTQEQAQEALRATK